MNPEQQPTNVKSTETLQSRLIAAFANMDAVFKDTNQPATRTVILLKALKAYADILIGILEADPREPSFMDAVSGLSKSRASLRETAIRQAEGSAT